jgi:hypothetical protein
MVRHFYRRLLAMTAVSILAAAVAQAGPVPDQSKRGAGSTNPQTTLKYEDTNAQPERFEGNVVCLQPGRDTAPPSASQCPDGEKVLALAIKDSDDVQPLIAVDGKIHDMLVDRMGEPVVIEGKRYEGSGMIMASTVLSKAAAD